MPRNREDVADEINADRVNTSTFSASDANQQLWNQFKQNTLPKLKDIESQIAGRQDQFTAEAADSANKAIELAGNQSELSRSALGISLTPEQEAANQRLEQLGLATATTSAQNSAVDVADQVNKSQASTLTSIQTGLTQDALANLTGSQNLQDARTASNINSDAQASNANTATAASVITLAAMMM